MNVFYVRNLFSLMNAENIIIFKKIKEAIIVVHSEFHYSDRTVAFEVSVEEQILKNLNPVLWNKVIVIGFSLDLLQRKVSKISNIPEIILRKITFRYIIRTRKLIFAELFHAFPIDKVYFVEPNRVYDERIFYRLAKKNGSKLISYPEGLFNNQKVKKPLKSKLDKIFHWIKNLINKVLDFIFFFDLLGFDSIKGDDILNYHFDLIYSNFPNYDPRQHTILLDRVIPSKKINNDNFLMKSLFISRPLSEDGFMSLEEEILLLTLISNKHSNKTFIRFHPRDCIDKIKLIYKLNLFQKLPVDLENISAENIIYSYNPKLIIGFESTTLIWASEFIEYKVISYIGDIKSSYHIHLKNIMIDLFPTIIHESLLGVTV